MVGRHCRGIQYPFPLLNSQLWQTLLQEPEHRRLVQPLVSWELGHLLLGHSREHSCQQTLGFGIEQVLPSPTVAQYVEDRLTILRLGRLVARVELVADDLAIPILAVDPGAGVIEVLPGAARKSRLEDRRLLGVERLLGLDQEVRDLPLRDHNPDLAVELDELGLGDVGPEVQGDAQRPEARAELALVANRQRREVGLALAWRVVLLLVEEDVVRAEDDVLDDDVLVALELGVLRERRPIELERLLPIDPNLIQLLALLPLLGGAPLLLRGVVARSTRRGLRGVGLDLGLALLAFEPSDLVAKSLVLRPQFAVLSLEFLDQVQQQDEALADPFIADRREVQVFEHRRGSKAALGRQTRLYSTPPVSGRPQGAQQFRTTTRPRFIETIPSRRQIVSRRVNGPTRCSASTRTR